MQKNNLHFLHILLDIGTYLLYNVDNERVREEKKMRYIDRTGKTMNERGESKEIESMGKLTKTACRKAKEMKLGVLKTHWGAYRVIRECGLGAGYTEAFKDLAEVDTFIKSL